MITNKKTFLKEVKKDFPEFIDDKAIIQEAEEKLCINGGDDVEFSTFRNHKQVVNLYRFETLKNGRKRFI